MPINDGFKHQVKSANPLESVIANYVSLKRSGRNYLCCCPFHSEKTPSFYINVDEGFYKCFGCGESGDVFSFVMKMENLDFVEALKFLSDRAGIPMPKWDKSSSTDRNSQERSTILEINREAGRFFYKQLTPQVLNYIKYNRNISASTALQIYHIGYAPNDWFALTKHLRSLGFKDDDIVKAGLAKINKSGALFDFFRNRLMVPILDIRGNVIAFGGRVLDDSMPKYLNSPDTPVFKKSENLFSLNLAKKSVASERSIILAEGYMDVIALYQAGFKNAVASLGTSLTPEQVSIIKRYTDEVIICYDNDNAGINATNRAISLLLNSSNDKDLKIKVLQMTGAKDPDEYIKNYGNEKFKLLLQSSVDAIEFQLNQARTDLNLNTNSGKIEMLKRSANILAQIPNTSTREVYVSSIARECNIESSTFSETVNSIIIKNNRLPIKRNYSSNLFKDAYKKPLLNNSQHNQISNDMYVAINEGHSQEKVFKSECEVIAYISKFYELIPYAKENLTVKDFNSNMHKNIFKAICEHSEALTSLNDKSIIHSDLSEDEFNYFLNIYDKYRDIIEYDTAQQGLSDCIKNLLEVSQPQVLVNNNLVDLNQLKNKKLQEQKYKNIT